jgi:three-Cys-motif partner protein
MTNAYFEESLPEWSARKHAILKAYLPRFCTALSRVARQHYEGAIWYIDGYAGAGVHKEDGSPGSPVLAAQVTRDLPYDVRCINVEENDDNFASLQKATATFDHVVNYHADFNQIVSNVLQQVKNCPSFFFLDSYGPKDLPMSGLIDKIASRTVPTDILLRYDSEGLRRIAGAYEKDIPRSAAHAQNLTKAFRGDGWRDILKQEPAGKQRDELLLAYYKQQLISIPNGRFKYTAAYPIRTIEGRLKYHLLFATGSPLGVKIMSDILYDAENSFVEQQAAYRKQKEEAAPFKQLGFDLFEENLSDPTDLAKQKIEAIRRDIIKLMKSGKDEWDFEQLFNELIINHGWSGRMLEKDFRDTCKSMEQNGELFRMTQGKSWQRGTRLKIGFD